MDIFILVPLCPLSLDGSNETVILTSNRETLFFKKTECLIPQSNRQSNIILSYNDIIITDVLSNKV